MSDETPPSGGEGADIPAAEGPVESALGPDFHRWLTQQFVPKKGRSVLKLDLYHLNSSGSSFVRKWDDSELSGGGTPLIQEIHEAAEQDAMPYMGIQTYTVIVSFTDPRNNEPTRRPFHVRGGQSESRALALGSSEGPNSGGMIQMSMRHANAMAETFLRGQQFALKALAEMVEGANKRAEAAESRQIDVLRLHSELLIKKDEREFEMEEKRDSRQLKNQLLEFAGSQLLTAAGPAIERLLKNVGGAPAKPPELDPKLVAVIQALGGFASQLDENSFSAILQALPEDKRGAFVNLVQKLQEASPPPPQPETKEGSS